MIPMTSRAPHRKAFNFSLQCMRCACFGIEQISTPYIKIKGGSQAHDLPAWIAVVYSFLFFFPPFLLW